MEPSSIELVAHINGGEVIDTVFCTVNVEKTVGTIDTQTVQRLSELSKVDLYQESHDLENDFVSLTSFQTGNAVDTTPEKLCDLPNTCLTGELHDLQTDRVHRLTALDVYGSNANGANSIISMGQPHDGKDDLVDCTIINTRDTRIRKILAEKLSCNMPNIRFTRDRYDLDEAGLHKLTTLDVYGGYDDVENVIINSTTAITHTLETLSGRPLCDLSKIRLTRELHDPEKDGLEKLTALDETGGYKDNTYSVAGEMLVQN